jgi:hypothetical protein
MAPVEQSLHESTRAPAWFLEFLKRELAPYPGRTGIVVRMLKSPQATLQSAGTTLLFVGIGGAYVLISAGFVITVPILHFLWVIGSFFLAFYALSAMANYSAASTFALVIAVGIPIWERHVSAQTNVADTLWLTLAVSVGALVTAAIELALSRAPILSEMPNTVSLTPKAFTNSAYTKVHLALLRDVMQSKPLAPDAFVNPEHLRFAIRGCLAASGCYIQIAVVFCLINLQEFARQTSVAAARDRIVGVGLGLCMMWLVFDSNT